jgi:hypothetical protein
VEITKRSLIISSYTPRLREIDAMKLWLNVNHTDKSLNSVTTTISKDNSVTVSKMTRKHSCYFIVEYIMASIVFELQTAENQSKQ